MSNEPIRTPFLVNPPPRHRSPPTDQPRNKSAVNSSPGPTGEGEDQQAPPLGDYEVGYKRTPVHSRFQPGQSGNPRGKRKGAKSFKTIARETAQERIAIRTPNGQKYVTKAQAMLMKLVEKAGQGHVPAIRAVLEIFEQALPLTSSATETERIDQTDEQIIEAFRGLIQSGGAS